MAPELSLQSPVKASIGEPEAYVEEVIRRLVDEYPPRRATSEAEREAHQWVAQELETLGLSTDLEGFLFNDNLYSVIALHFGVATAGAALSGRLPRLAAAMQLGAAASYWLDSTKRVEVLRRAFPYRPSQNLVARLPASRAGPASGVVFVSHIDAAFTGLLFDPRFIRTFTNKGAEVPYVSRSLEVATHSAAAGGLLSLVRSVSHRRPRPLGRLQALLAIPSVLSLLLNADVVRRDHTVPGAADNLSGVAGTLLLAERMLGPHPEVEYVFVVTGAEEAGTGGARRLLEAHRGEWSTDDTVVLGLDTLCNGEFFYTEEGEQGMVPLSAPLAAVLGETGAADDRFSDVRKFQVPVGSTDASPFAYAGYEAATLSCVDLEQGSPRHYHHPTDTPENTDAAAVVHAVDYAEAFTRRLTDSRLGSPSGH